MEPRRTIATRGIPQRAEIPVPLPSGRTSGSLGRTETGRTSQSVAYNRPSTRPVVADRAIPRSPAECGAAMQELVRQYRDFRISREDYIAATIRWARDAQAVGLAPRVALEMANAATTGRRDTRWSYVFLQPDLARVTADCVRYALESPVPQSRSSRRTTGNNAVVTRTPTPVVAFADLVLPPELDLPINRNDWR